MQREYGLLSLVVVVFVVVVTVGSDSGSDGGIGRGRGCCALFHQKAMLPCEARPPADLSHVVLCVHLSRRSLRAFAQHQVLSPETTIAA